MAITVDINSSDVTDQIRSQTLVVKKQITYKRDTATFKYLKAGSKTLTPTYGDTVEIYDGADKIFGGTVLTVNTSRQSGVDGVLYEVRCVDWIYEMDKQLASKTYENKTIAEIVSDLISSYTTGFTSNNVDSTFTIEKIVFNQIPISTCIKKLADVVGYDWFVDVDKDVHMFQRFSNTAPFDLTDTNGNYVYKSLTRVEDGSQVVNTVKVRGGEYNGSTYTDEITVSGSGTKSFKLPYRFANLSVTLDTGGGAVAQDVGIDFIDDFSNKDVLHNYQDQMIHFENALSDGDVIGFSGNPKVPVFAISEDPVSVEQYGTIEKLLRDNAIESNTIARKRATAELYVYSSPIIDAKFTTYESGLDVGMLLDVKSDNDNFEDDLIIKTITFSMRDHDNFVYAVECVSTRRFDFITLMQKILEPEPRVGDENETSESIFTDTQNVELQEEYENVSAFDDEQDITTQENYELDPLGDDTNATYVLGSYSPSSQSDPKRPGRLGISFVVH